MYSIYVGYWETFIFWSQTIPLDLDSWGSQFDLKLNLNSVHTITIIITGLLPFQNIIPPAVRQERRCGKSWHESRVKCSEDCHFGI